MHRFSRFNSSLVEVFIDNKPLKVPASFTIIQACAQAQIDIPRFCYHERLAIAGKHIKINSGNCRMCLVEVEKSPKPIASCAMPVSAGMKIITDSPMVKKAREGVMEFLLANHPLDCVICDQGGECDLQDQAMAFGSDTSRLDSSYEKRAVEDKDFGPLIKTSMNRCIHCTRCVRFANEVAGFEALGTCGRGNTMEIGTFIKATVNNEMSANIIDLCPVGALTSKPYAFKARPWELKKTESIDTMDALGSNIRVDSRGPEVMRVLPRLNEAINEEWISDKTRFACDGLSKQRLVRPLIRSNGSFSPIGWEEALTIAAEKLNNAGSDLEVIAGQFADAESLTCLSDLLLQRGSNNLFMDGAYLNQVVQSDLRSDYIFNSSIEGVEEADYILFVGTDLKKDAPVLNARIRKTWLRKDLLIASVGDKAESTFDCEYIGPTLKDLNESILDKVKERKIKLLIIGDQMLFHPDFSFLEFLAKKHSMTINVVHKSAGTVAALDLGYNSTKRVKQSSLVYLLNADQVELQPGSFVIYQGHHGDKGASQADLILPGAAYTEKDATFVNIEGRSQSTKTAVPPPGDSKEDWTILRALSEIAGRKLPYDTLDRLRSRMSLLSPHLTSYGRIEAPLFVNRDFAYKKPDGTIIKSEIYDFYLTDAISRASVTMSKCSKQFTFAE